MNQTASELTASAVRAELARRQITRKAFAAEMGWSISTTRRRLAGEIPFDVAELARIADWIDVPVTTFVPGPRAVA